MSPLPAQVCWADEQTQVSDSIHDVEFAFGGAVLSLQLVS